jgi:hypothetical protein
MEKIVGIRLLFSYLLKFIVIPENISHLSKSINFRNIVYSKFFDQFLGKAYPYFFAVFLLIRKRDCDRGVLAKMTANGPPYRN